MDTTLGILQELQLRVETSVIWMEFRHHGYKQARG